MTIVEALKELVGKIKGVTPDNITEETIAELIKVIADLEPIQKKGENSR